MAKGILLMLPCTSLAPADEQKIRNAMRALFPSTDITVVGDHCMTLSVIRADSTDGEAAVQ